MKTKEDGAVLAQLNLIFKQKRGFSFKIPPKTGHIILLLSGGFDSILIWGLLMKTYSLHVHPISITKKKGEKQAIKDYSKIYKKLYPHYFHEPVFKEYEWLFGFRDVERVEIDPYIIGANRTKEEGLPYSLINNPSRLGIFAFISYEYALLLKYRDSVSIDTIITGVVMDDSYRDQESTLTTHRSVNLTLCLTLNDFRWQFSGMVDRKNNFSVTKKELLQYAVKNKFPLERTWSCHFDRFYQCGSCTSCLGRVMFFNRNRYKDKTTYLSTFPFMKLFKKIGGKKKENNVKEQKKAILTKSNLNMKITVSPDVKWDYFNDEASLLHTKTSLHSVLNKTGSIMWMELAKREYTVSEMVNFLQKKYCISKQKALKDILSYINDLKQKEFIL